MACRLCYGRLPEVEVAGAYGLFWHGLFHACNLEADMLRSASTLFTATLLLGILLVFTAHPLLGDEKQPKAGANTWVKLDRARIGPRGDPGLVYDPVTRRFLVLGGGISWPTYAR